MPEPTFFKVVLNPKTNLFILTINLNNNRRGTIELTPNNFMLLVQYLGKVALSYKLSMDKNNGF